MAELEPIFERVSLGDPVGAAYRLTQEAGPDASGRFFYEAGSLALARRDELGEDVLRFARICFAEAVERDPLLGEAHHDLATTMRELGMAEDAITHYHKALELLPDDSDAMIGLGAAQCDAGHTDDAIASLERATVRHPESGAAFANLGIALEAAGKDTQAAAAYSRAVARFDAELEAGPEDSEAAGEIAARRRWSRIQLAELLERLERWPQAIVEYRRLYEEEQAIAEAREAEAAEAEGQADAQADDDDDSSELPPPPPMTDAEAAPPDDDEGETLLDTGEVGDQPEAAAAEHASDDAEDADEPDDVDDDGEAAGRNGLERVFSRLVMTHRHDLAFLVLDDLGGELADERTRATYTIFHDGEGLPAVMVEHWDGGNRERLEDPAPGAPVDPAARA